MSLYDNIRKKKARIKAGSGETMRKKGDKQKRKKRKIRQKLRLRRLRRGKHNG